MVHPSLLGTRLIDATACEHAIMSEITDEIFG